jgi:poly(A) polymerase
MTTDVTGDVASSAEALREAPWFKAAGVQRVLDLLNDEGADTRIVGGAVRNALMGLPVVDIDLATNLKPEEVIARAETAKIKSLPTGIEHGTVTLVVDGQTFEVTTLRTDVETDGRRAVVAFGTDWAEDAARRDFTINALYLDRNGELVDLVDGLADIETKTVRFIGDADLRITEDYLRVLRFFRFFAHFGGGRPDADGIRAAARHKEGIAKLSAERVWAELKKLLAARDPSRALLWMRQSGVLTEVLPETEKWGIDSIHGLVHAEEAFGWEPDPLLRLLAIVPPDEARLEAMAKRLKMSRAEARRLQAYARAEDPAHGATDVVFHKHAYRASGPALMDRLKLKLASARMRARSETGALAEAAGYARLIERLGKWQRPVFPISGKDLSDLGLKQGPKLGALLSDLEEAWISSNFIMTRDDLLSKAAARIAEKES